MVKFPGSIHTISSGTPFDNSRLVSSLACDRAPEQDDNDRERPFRPKEKINVYPIHEFRHAQVLPSGVGEGP